MQQINKEKEIIQEILQKKYTLYHCIAEIEIERILRLLGKDIVYIEEIFRRYRKLWDNLRPGLAYKDSEILTPLVIYFYLRFQQIPLDTFYLIEISKISSKMFFDFVFQILDIVSTILSIKIIRYFKIF